MELWHESAGSGRTVVMIHAGICDARMWDRQMETLAGVGRIVRLDLPGFGRTPVPTGPYVDAGEVIRLIEAEDLAPAVVIGVSMGGGVALDLATARPELVSGLVLVGTTHPSQQWSAGMEAADKREEQLFEAGDVEALIELNLRIWIDGPSRSPDEVDPELRAFVGEMQRGALTKQMAQPEPEAGELTADLAAALPEITTPTLVMVGDLDIPEMVESANLLAGDIAGARTEVIVGASHLPNLERPEEFDELVLGFLDGLAD